MIYVFQNYDETESVYEGLGLDLDLEALRADFEKEFYGIEPFQVAGRYQKILEARKRGVTREFRTWLLEHYDLKPIEFKVVQV